VRLKIEIHKIYENQCFYTPIVSATCLNQQRQLPTLSGRRTWTVDEIEVASSLNFSILVECGVELLSSLLNACECVDFVSSRPTGFRGSR